MKNVRKNFCTRYLAQLITPCGSRLLSWKDLRFLKRVSNKGSVPACRNYWFNPQWAISFNRNTNSFLVGRVITTYPAPRNEALISHWIASSIDDLLSEFTACQGCASAISRSSTSKTLLNDVLLKDVFLMFRYAKSLLLFHLFAPVRLPFTSNQTSRISDIQLPSSVSTLYIDGSFLFSSSHPIPSMAYAWTAIDPDGFILESHYNIISSIFPSALRSEVFALLHGLDSLPWNSKITVATDCAQLLSLWSLYNLDVTLIKVPAHADDPLNNHVDVLAKAAHTDSHLSSCPPSELMRYL
ncbi:hypothetical protein GLOIN_2v1785823 [Rhizophagus irregularis DAOM 181602=DAOM 197198]|nr:hypothetical protein GLOIN_2v1785823 [Rhizophagus irregularis DAOM 181602=DAOM 197198]